MSFPTDKHKSEKILVCGTGPSIDQHDREFYMGWSSITIGVNDIIAKFIPDYHLNIHEHGHVLRCFNDEWREAPFKFRNPSAGVDVEKTGRLSMVGTVALTALTAAYQMGATEIHLIGVDLKWGTDGQRYFKGRPFPLETEDWAGHFINKEDELRATVLAFKNAAALYRAAGVKVVNLSNDTLLEGI